MVLRFLMRYLANNEQLIQRMSESYPIRRAAQLAVSLMYRTKSLAREQGLHEMTPERFKSFMNMFKNNVRQELEGVKKEINNKKKN
ncbi:protein NCBP2AS2 homolog [Drosophila bipectinata]|uniref:protein NCBP2AS2 homolog n=1 Tax=Drosophila bipectinata TaxID=42026 RepID=UPI001C89CDF3|nr:protein NCBP2AS2 homolog [Drosophila bipectinata]